MKLPKSKLYRFLYKHWWEFAFGFFFAFGIAFCFFGFLDKGENESSSTYNAIKVFLLHHSFKENTPISCMMEVGRWFLVIAFVLLSFKLFLTIIAPKFIGLLKIKIKKNHIVICGLNKFTMGLINKCPDKKIVVITSGNSNQYVESLKQRRIKLIIGNPTDQKILKLANIAKAKRLYAITSDDNKNVDIAYNACELSKKSRKLAYPLEALALINDSDLKQILEESALFKYNCLDDKGKAYFDGMVFNFHESGTKHGIKEQLKLILPLDNTTQHTILIIGIDPNSENVILCLAHCITMNGKTLKFVIVDKSEKAIEKFKHDYYFLQEFAEFEFIHKDIELLSQNELCSITNIIPLSSIFVCWGSYEENIKISLMLRFAMKNEKPDIFVFCNYPETISIVLNDPANENLLLRKDNIHTINTFDEAFDYILELEEKLEQIAKLAHEKWNEANENKMDYEKLTEHFKQSNRNQISDYYFKVHIAIGKSLEECLEQNYRLNFTPEQREMLSNMEHRRWMIEKYLDWWTHGKAREDRFRKHPDLVPWDQLLESAKRKDRDAIDLMMQVMNGERGS